jgi:leucyl aminopeptidase
MCGAANTLAIMKELDEKDLNVNVVACLCLAENNISGGSCKPSDIYTAYNKKTVDIIHTDAEGRLILADGMSYISKNYNLQHIMTIATLT